MKKKKEKNAVPKEMQFSVFRLSLVFTSDASARVADASDFLVKTSLTQ